ncbi:MAG: hypothetical protein HQ593_04680 [Candidatus Omnitrophica bacterium]|nr:hypothetical protein [Candidatus Omnitrophota bacterium]
MRRSFNKRLALKISIPILIAFLAITVWADVRADFIIGKLNQCLTAYINQRTGFDVSIDEIEGGVYRDLQLMGVKLVGSDKKSIATAKGLTLRCRLWDVLFKKSRFGTEPVEFDFQDGQVFYIEWSDRPLFKKLKGFLKLTGDSLKCEGLKGEAGEVDFELTGNLNELYKEPFIDADLGLSWRDIKVSSHFEGSKDDLSLNGKLSLSQGEAIDFSGKCTVVGKVLNIEELDFNRDGVSWKIEGGIDLERRVCDVRIHPTKGVVGIRAEFSPLGNYTITTKVRHCEVGGVDILGDLEVEGDIHIEKGSLKEFSATCSVVNPIVDYKPIKETTFDISASGGTLYLDKLQFGDDISAAGSASLSEPYDIILQVDLHSRDLNSLFSFVKKDLNNSGGDLISGSMEGKLILKGPAVSPQLTGALVLREGNIGEMDFDSMNVELKGKGPLIEIADSRINRQNGCLFMDGEFDLRKLRQGDAFDDIKITADQNAIIWKGWDISKDRSEKKLSLKKDIDKEFEVSFKTSMSDKEAIYDSEGEPEDGDDSRFELMYEIKKGDKFKVQLEEDDEFVGLEHKMQF